MMGKRDPQKQLWSYQVNLDKRVRSDHALRRINQALDLDFVRPEVARFYGTKGNVSEDPVVTKRYLPLPGWPSNETTAAALRAIGLGICHQAGRVFGLSVTEVL